MDNERRKRYLARYQEQKALGESFFPYTIHKDAIFSLLVFLVLVALAAFVGAPLEARADPTNTAYVPRPEWYFMFLFEMLKYFPGEFEWVGVVVVPGAAILFLFLLPILDRSSVRHPRQRRLAVNITVLAVVAVTFLTLRAYQVTPASAMSFIQGGWMIDSTPKAATVAKSSGSIEEGKKIFTATCNSCHPNAEAGVGPSLKGVSAEKINQMVRNGKDIMPAFSTSQVTDQQLKDIVAYLTSLK